MREFLKGIEGMLGTPDAFMIPFVLFAVLLVAYFVGEFIVCQAVLLVCRLLGRPSPEFLRPPSAYWFD